MFHSTNYIQQSFQNVWTGFDNDNDSNSLYYKTHLFVNPSSNCFMLFIYQMLILINAYCISRQSVDLHPKYTRILSNSNQSY